MPAHNAGEGCNLVGLTLLDMWTSLNCPLRIPNVTSAFAQKADEEHKKQIQILTVVSQI